MEFLLESSVLSSDEERNYSSLNTKDKITFINNYLKSLSTYKYFKEGENIITQLILDSGFDTNKNKFLEYIEEIPNYLNRNTVLLLINLINGDKVKVESDWLYNQSVYADKENTEFYLKALTYASDKNFQNNASKKINLYDLFNVGSSKNLRSAKIKSRSDIEKILNSITVKNAYKIGSIRGLASKSFKEIVNTITSYIKKYSTPSNTNTAVIDALNSMADSKQYDELKKILNIDIDDTSEKSIAKAVVDYINFNKNTLKINKSKVDTNKADTTKTDDKDKKTAKSTVKTGQDVLKDYFKDDSIGWTDLRDYLYKLFNNDPNKVTAQEVLNDDQAFDVIKDDIRDVLNSKIVPTLDEQPIELLNKKLKQAINDSIKGPGDR